MATAKQFRFYSQNSIKNYAPKEHPRVSYNSLVNGTLFKLGEDNPAFQIGIQALPGTKFYLNNGRDFDSKIIIGSTGIYELNTENININIIKLQFDGQSINDIDQNDNACLIVDIIYTT